MDVDVSSITLQALLNLKIISDTEKNELIILLWKQIERLLAQCARIAGLEKKIKEL